MAEESHTLKSIDFKKIATLLGGCVIFLAITGAIAFLMRPCDESEKPCEGFWEWINNGPIGMDSLAVGFSTSIAFGFIDNVLLMSGMSSLDAVFERLPGGEDPIVAAGYGNAFSSTISMFGSAFVGKIISDLTGAKTSPIWAQSIGVLIGGILGIFLSKLAASLFGAPEPRRHLAHKKK